ncbi:MAG: RHS repeat-associated core domain-containing protein, partial [Desulfobacteraceae bacterium]|nr:RHS repeat-associated core domain-containing protein [Desulfobacteraceae bacterium]
DQPFMFSTKRYLAGPGLNYYGYRFYQPKVGRWLKRDPLQEAGGLNLYGFVLNNPVNWVDPLGLERKPGKTPPTKAWPKPPRNVAGKKPKWSPEGYWKGKKGRRLTWDDRSHGAGVDRGQGEQGGHWDDETSDNRWDKDGNPLPGSSEYNDQQDSGTAQQIQQYTSDPAIQTMLTLLLMLAALLGWGPC